jgi:hypothetical protein
MLSPGAAEEEISNHRSSDRGHQLNPNLDHAANTSQTTVPEEQHRDAAVYSLYRRYSLGLDKRSLICPQKAAQHGTIAKAPTIPLPGRGLLGATTRGQLVDNDNCTSDQKAIRVMIEKAGSRGELATDC